jgi:hypothetical protein
MLLIAMTATLLPAIAEAGSRPKLKVIYYYLPG